MAEENLSPISAPQPPAVNPLGAATAAHASTLKLKPVIRKPTIGGGLKPGLKLPPKPGATVGGLKPGLKLPPKPGATVGALSPGLKMPTKPGIPQIRKKLCIQFLHPAVIAGTVLSVQGITGICRQIAGLLCSIKILIF